MKVNLNHGILILSNLEFGRHCGVEVKIGRQTYLYDITVDALHARIIPRREDGKFIRSVLVKRHALLDREFFEHFEDIGFAQFITEKYRIQYQLA